MKISAVEAVPLAIPWQATDPPSASPRPSKHRAPLMDRLLQAMGLRLEDRPGG